MHLFSAILFAISANMDNIPLGIAYGMRGIKITLLKNIIIALVTSIGTFVSMSFGKVITLFLSEDLAAVIGCSVLMAMGLWFIFQFFLKRRKIRHTAEPEPPQDESTASAKRTAITAKQSVGLALVLMVNNMGFGISANIAGLPVIPTSICTFACSMALLSAGVTIGLKLSNDVISAYSQLISGILITILGFYELFV